VELPAAPRLALAVHEHCFLVEQVPGLATRIDEISELKQLTEANSLATDRYCAPGRHLCKSARVSSESHRHHLPQLSTERPFVTDGGLETDLIFNRGVELPDFAAFVLLEDPDGMRALRDYYDSFFAIAREHGAGFILDTPTWRANRDWGERLGYGRARLADANKRWAEVVSELRGAWDADAPVVLGATVGPRGDGYVSGEMMSADEAADYHGEQIGTFAETAVDMVTVLTLNYAEEATGVARAAAARGLPSVISFTVETDGRLPTGQELGEAIDQVDSETGGAPAYFMVNCAHPTHFEQVLAEGGSWRERIRGIRANASIMSHAELDELDDLDAGDPAELAAGYERLRVNLPNLSVLGGCCGTDHRHVAAICERLA
jgi:homocysteine S-methyltransferase